MRIFLVVIFFLCCFSGKWEAAKANMADMPFVATDEVKNYEQAAKEAGISNGMPIKAKEVDGQLLFREPFRQNGANPYEVSGFFDGNGNLKSIMLSGGRDCHDEEFAKAKIFLRRILFHTPFSLGEEDLDNLLAVLINYWRSSRSLPAYEECSDEPTDKFVFAFGKMAIYTVISRDLYEVKIDADFLPQQARQ